jgi:maleylacetoacetate isomerase
MKLYTFFRSSAAFRMRIALNLKGLAYESAFVSLPKMEHKQPEFSAVNPQQLVPALDTGKGVFIQSMAIMEYLDETHPSPPFLPKTPEARAYVRALSQVIACDIHPLNNVRVLKYLETELGHPQPVRDKWYAHWIREGFVSLEGLLEREKRAGKFCHGDAPGMADICLVPQVFNAQRFNCPTGDYPIAMRIFEACMALKPFQDAAPMKQGDAA